MCLRKTGIKRKHTRLLVEILSFRVYEIFVAHVERSRDFGSRCVTILVEFYSIVCNKISRSSLGSSFSCATRVSFVCMHTRSLETSLAYRIEYFSWA